MYGLGCHGFFNENFNTSVLGHLKKWRGTVGAIQYLRAPSRTIVTVDPERFRCVEVLYDNVVLSLA